MNRKELLERINVATRSNVWRLDLSDNTITELPSEIGRLTQLKELDLAGNHLTKLPPEIGQLTQLIDLDLNSNKLVELPSEIGQLRQLSRLTLAGNKLTDLPPEIGLLTNLTKLYLNGNRLAELPPEIGQLESLTSLYLNGNRLTELPPEISQLAKLYLFNCSQNHLIKLPSEIGQLKRLNHLYLHANQLTQLPSEIGQLTNLTNLYLDGNHLTELPTSIGHLHQLGQLDLGDSLRTNPIKTLPPEIGQLKSLNQLALDGLELIDPPPEIIKQGTEAVLAYLREQLEDERPVWESKLILVGEGGVGKTQLLKSLQGGEFQTHSETTWGIDVTPLPIAHPEQPDVTMMLNCWDFGGQEIYHATHQFFLTTRSLFLLAWNARLGWQQGKLNYWLDTIQALAPNSPVMIVATHIDERSADLPLDDLKEKYPQIIGEWSVSNKDRKLGDGIDQLCEVICKTAADLPLMGQSWPGSYWRAAETIRSLDKEQKYITAGRLEEIMTDSGVSPESHDVLAKQLHQLGDILFFDDDDELQDTVLLDPSWVSKMISNVLVHDKIVEGIGVFRRQHMEEVWPDLEPIMRDRFLRLMEKFDLSYRIPDDPENKSLVVERLSQDPPDYHPQWKQIGEQEDCREIRMQIDPQSTRPAGIPTWFIARSHRFTTDTHWRYGALFQDKTGRHLALAEAPPSERFVRLTVRGPNPNNFFAVLRDGLELTLDRFPGLKLKRTIPCPKPKRGEPDKPCPHHFDLSHLEERSQLVPPKLEIECPACFNDVSVSGLLFGLHWTTDSQVLARLDELEDANEERTARILGEIGDLRELSQRQFLIWFNSEQRLAESHCPRVFALRPQSQSKLFGSEWQLQVYCEAPGCWHPAMHGSQKGLYVIQEPAQWVKTIGPWVKRLNTVFKYAAHFAGPIMGSMAEDLHKLVENDIELMKAIMEKLPDIELEGDLKKSSDLGETDHPVRTADGASLRSLRQFLLELDPQQEWGDLRKTLTPEGHWLWLCEEHSAVYKL